MCMLCDDEKAYQAYMNYLDDLQRQGKGADIDKAMDAMLAAMTGNKTELPDTALSAHFPSAPVASSPPPSSRFSCDPVDE